MVATASTRAEAYHGDLPQGSTMALTATIRKAELQISDMDRDYYAAHSLTLAQHPSETNERLMVRLIAFALFAHDRLEFGKGLSDETEPDLWLRDYSGDIELWIDLGQPDESRVRKACNRSRKTVVIGYAGNATDIWWKKNSAALARHRNLEVIDLDADSVAALANVINRGMRLSIFIQDGELQLLAEDGTELSLKPCIRQALAA